MFNYRMVRLNQLQEQNVPDTSNEYDIDLSDMQDYKFKVGEYVDYY